MDNVPNMVANCVAKSGWLLRQTTVLHRWKRTWFVLYSSGRFTYYEDQNSGRADDFVHVPAQRAVVLDSVQCADVTPPEGKSRELLFGVRAGDKTWFLCADDEDELLAWKLSLEEAQNIRPTAPQGGGGGGGVGGFVPPTGMHAFYPGQASGMHAAAYSQPIQLPPGSYLYMTQNGPVIVDQYGNQMVLANNGQCYSCNGRGSGFLTGAAFGSLMMWPWLMMPLFWW